MLNSKNLLTLRSLNNSLKLKNLSQPSLLSINRTEKLLFNPNTSWVYCFIDKNEYGVASSVQNNYKKYIGSTISPLNRMRSYYHKFSPYFLKPSGNSKERLMKPLKISKLILSAKLRSKTNKALALSPRRNFGSNNFYLYVGVNTPNYVQVWQTQNPNKILAAPQLNLILF